MRVLHLDDDPLMLVKARTALSANNFEGACEHIATKTEEEFWRSFSAHKPDCVLLDIVMQNKSDAGIQILNKLRDERDYKNPVIMMSTVADANLIRSAIQAGANDFVTKGIDDVELSFRVRHAINACRQVHVGTREGAQRFAGETMRSVLLKIPRILASMVRSVLVVGESGTGKEVVAQALKDHLAGTAPFVPVNCAAIAKDLMEAELFGYEKGSFTGAQSAKPGLFSAADGGWIFLDEVARLSLPCQAALLRTLESGEVRPVGSTRATNVKVRVLAATNEDLDVMVEKGEFREDLLQRLRAYEIFLPPLRERMNELPELVDAMLARMNSGGSKEIRLAPAVRNLFMAHSWKRGNVRELWQVLQAASVEAVEGVVTFTCLPKSFVSGLDTQAIKKEPSTTTVVQGFTFPLVYTELEESFFLDVLEALSRQMPQALSSQRKVSEALGITRHSVASKLERIASTRAVPDKFTHLLSKQ